MRAYRPQAFLVAYAEETDSNADRYRESDRSSNLSDVKADIRAGSSVSNAESVTALDSEGEGSTRGVNALALAGPVPNPLGYRYSADYTEPSFPPKNNVSNSPCVSRNTFIRCFSITEYAPLLKASYINTLTAAPTVQIFSPILSPILVALTCHRQISNNTISFRAY